MEEYIKTTIYTSSVTLNQIQAKEVIEYFHEHSPEIVTKYGFSEPINKKWNDESKVLCSKRLIDYPSFNDGEVSLKTKNGTFVFQFLNSIQNPFYINIYIEASFFKKSENIHQYVHFLTNFFQKYPVFYAFSSSISEIRTKHYYIEEDGRRAEYKVGLDIKQHLTGIYWLTYFGKSISSELQLINLPNECEVKDINSGCLLQLSASPFDFNENLLALSLNLIDKIGSQYFFNIHNQRDDHKLPNLLTEINQRINENDFIIVPSTIPNKVPVQLESNFLEEDVKQILETQYDQIDKYIGNLIEKLKKNNDTEDVIISKLGKLVGDIITTKYSLKWSYEKAGYIEVDEDEFINPFNITFLIMTNSLILSDFMEYIEDFYV